MRKLITVAVAGSLIGLTACTAPDKSKETTTSKTEAPTPTKTKKVEPETPKSNSGEFTNAAFAYPIVADGEVVKTIETEKFTITVFRTATGVTDADERYKDPDTGVLLLPAGTPRMAVNFVLTNNTTETLDIGTISLQISGTHPDWPFSSIPYLEESTDWFEGLGLHRSEIDFGADAEMGIIAPKESFAQSSVWPLWDGPYNIEMKLVGKDSEGNLDHDNPLFDLTEQITFKP
ncbi:hypothetical protein G7066_12760 [Leucobacter coleopterorum]|uniref:DUF4352 domain-containing protein n=1 Tax=Leucobacter coleopterorum TaxID=2714933 RepID=A0ABX6JY27_9MICO|nr:hypothetical protein [Leucobacter coleopterorum]QIM19221.1 hypothetical protein G7066_12760 [Leucobacter coleopterorum]